VTIKVRTDPNSELLDPNAPNATVTGGDPLNIQDALRQAVVAASEPASDEQDDLVAALEARERLANSGGSISLEESMRENGVDPDDLA
jgi:hypothetical protein